MSLYLGKKRVIAPTGRRKRTLSQFLIDTGYGFGAVTDGTLRNPLTSYVGVLDYTDGKRGHVDPFGKFAGLLNLKEIPLIDLSGSSDWWRAFRNCKSLVTIPAFDTSKVTDFNSAFYNCSSLTSLPQLDTSNVTNFYCAFQNCSSLTSLPQLDTSNVTSFYCAFQNCSSLTSLPQLDTSKVTTFAYAFYNCSSLTSLPQLDTSNVTSFYYTFLGCKKLEDLSWLDLSSATNIAWMCYGCSSLKKVPSTIDCSRFTSLNMTFGDCPLEENPVLTNTSNVKGFQATFQGSHGSTLALFDTSNATNFNSFLRDMPNLEEVPAFDFSKGTDFTLCFYGSWKIKAIHAYGFKATWNIDSRMKLDHDGVVEILNNLGTLDEGKTATFGTGGWLSKLTDEEKKIATDKGWTLS